MNPSSNSISVKYDCTSLERAQATLVIAGRPVQKIVNTSRRHKAIRALMGWLVFLGLLLALFWHLRGMRPLPRRQVNSVAIETPADVKVAYGVLAGGVAGLSAGLIAIKTTSARTNDRWKDERVLFMDDVGVTLQRPGSGRTVFWKTYSGFVEGPDVLVLKSPPHGTFPIPKRLFSDDELIAVRQLLQEHCPRLSGGVAPHGFPVVTT